MKLQQKLFLIQSGFSLILVASLVLLMQWSIGKGMIDYVNTKEIKTLAPVVLNLSVEYQKNNNWSFLTVQNERDRNKVFRSFIRDQLKSTGIIPSRSEQINNDRKFQHLEHLPRPNHKEHHRPPFKHHGSKHDNKRHGPPPDDVMNFVIFDENNNYIAGNYIKHLSYSRTPIEVNNIVVGYFGILKQKHLTQGYELDFLEQQQYFLWIMALGVMLMVILLTLPLAQYLVKPIQLVTDGMHKLTQGNYQQRIMLNRKDELGELSRDYNELAFTLAENESARKRWLANISHDLRTPIAIASLELEAMIDVIRPMTKENIASAHDELKHLAKLVDDLHQLTITDVGGMQYNKENEDLSSLLMSVKNKYQSYLAESGMALTLNLNLLDSPVNIYCDKTRLFQLFENIINNSVKYAQASQLNIFLSTDNVNAERANAERVNEKRANAERAKVESLDINNAQASVYLTFEDNGVGVDDKQISHLFEYLYRTDESRNRNNGGAGLGLSICRQIVNAHQGDIWAEKSSLGGLAIIIKLPLV